MRLMKLVVMVAAASALAPYAHAKTVIDDPAEKVRLMGPHMLALQWISWKRFGKAVVTEKNGTLYLKGEQMRKTGKGAGDYLRIDGRIMHVGRRRFTFVGDITTKVYHLGGGEPCRRSGEMTFRITGKRKYYRLQEMGNPCDAVTDYVDLFLRPKKGK